MAITLPLAGLKIAILLSGGFEQVEMTQPRAALELAGAKTELIVPQSEVKKSWFSSDKVQGWDGTKKKWGSSFKIDTIAEKALVKNYDALLLPGGVMNGDTLRTIPSAIQLVKGFIDAKKPIAVICHGSWILINANAIKGRKLTSWPSLELDLQNAGAYWVNQAVVRDENLISSRWPADLPAFNKEFITVLSQIQKKHKDTDIQAQLSQLIK